MMNKPAYYILNDAGEPVPCDDVLLWGAWFEAASRSGARILKQDYVEGEVHSVEIFGKTHERGVGVSTVFLGLDHNWRDVGPPVLWESMVFGTTLDGEQWRYTSREDALRGHAELLERVRAAYEATGPAVHPRKRKGIKRCLTRSRRIAPGAAPI